MIGFDEHGQITAIITGGFILITAIVSYTAIVLESMD